jgi:hypothetical protein
MIDFDKYFKGLQAHRVNEITEHSHRNNLQQLLESLAGPKIKVLHEPKREGKFGSPDFKITHTESIIGYIENKKIEENLDKILKTDQIKKYQALSDNILLTNYIEWIWIKEGKIQQRETLCFLTDIEDKRSKLDLAKVKAVEKLIKSFFSQAPKEIADAKKLAEALAIRAKLLKDFLLDELERQYKEHNEGRLYQLFETFKSFVFHELTIEEFADAFAQNLAYGLFLAKLNADTQSVNLYNAKKYIPTSFELIRELVNFLDELDNDEYRETKWIVEEVLTIMNNLDLRAIRESLSFTPKKKSKDKDNITIKDPYVYFYEDFLASYDKKLRKAKGVYYTPPPVVNFIVRSIDEILKKSFKIKDGLADRNKVTVLDFATGTGTFLVEVLQQIFENLPKGSGKKDLLIREHILKNIFGFEYLIAPYTIAHLKLSQFLKDNEYELKSKERLQIFLTNTLSPIDLQQKIPLLPALTEESKQAQEVKDKPILVITGNPPYSKKSKNNDPWIVNLVDAYKYVDGKRSKEKQSWYRDDYIKFIRFAQDKMDKVEEGIVGVITNHAFINNITMPGMRQSLMNSFDQIYVVNLNGSAKQEGKLPDGIAKDENVFDIEQGVSISFFIKRKGLEKKVFYTDFWGARRDKYLTCLEESIGSIKWTEIEPKTPDYYFIPKNEQHRGEYNTFYSVADIFKIYSLPLMSGRDSVTIKQSKREIKAVLKVFQEKTEQEIRNTLSAGNDSRDWKIANAKEDIKITNVSDTFIKEITYRLFDSRFTYYTGNAKGFHASPQFKVCKNMLFENIGLLLPRQISKSEFRHVFCTRLIPEMCAISTATKEQNQLFPLYLYPDITLANTQQKRTREENFTKDFRNYIDKLYGKGISPEQILGYMYAVLHSETYRTKYIEFLKDKFARIPFTKDKKQFEKLSKLGTELIEVHLLEAETDLGLGDFIGKGSSIVENITFTEERKIGKIYINKTQYFNDIPVSVWEFQIGGYQVIDKFLKERKNRELSIDEVEKVTSIINAIAFTIEQINKIETLKKIWI